MTENLAGRGEGLAGLVARIKWLHCLSGADLAHLPHPGVCLTTACDRCSLLRIVAALEAAAPAGTAPYALPGDAEGLAEVFWNGRKRISVIEWAQERLENTKRLAAEKSGADREGWLEDGHYWELIVAALATPSPQAPTCPTCKDIRRIKKPDGLGSMKCPDCAATQEPVGSGASVKVGEWFFHDSPSCTRRYSVQEKTESGCSIVCSTPYVHEGAKRDMELIAKLHNDPGSPRKVGEDYGHETNHACEHGIFMSENHCEACDLASQQRQAIGTPAGSGAQTEQASAKLKCGCQPIHSTECVFRDVRSSQYRHFYEFEKAGSPRKVGEDGGSGALREALEKHEYMNGSCLCREFRLPPYGKKELDEWALVRGDWMRDIRWKYWLEHILAALSLSSPIEPPPQRVLLCLCDPNKPHQFCPTHTQPANCICGHPAVRQSPPRCERWPKCYLDFCGPTSQASSEVREVREALEIAKAALKNGSTLDQRYRAYLVVDDALMTPSRQGAGGK